MLQTPRRQQLWPWAVSSRRKLTPRSKAKTNGYVKPAETAGVNAGVELLVYCLKLAGVASHVGSGWLDSESFPLLEQEVEVFPLIGLAP